MHSISSVQTILMGSTLYCLLLKNYEFYGTCDCCTNILTHSFHNLLLSDVQAVKLALFVCTAEPGSTVVDRVCRLVGDAELDGTSDCSSGSSLGCLFLPFLIRDFWGDAFFTRLDSSPLSSIKLKTEKC